MKKGDKKSRVAEIAAAMGFTSVDQEEEEGEVYQADKDLDQLRRNVEIMYGNGKNPEMYEKSMRRFEERKKELLDRENNHNSD